MSKEASKEGDDKVVHWQINVHVQDKVKHFISLSFYKKPRMTTWYDNQTHSFAPTCTPLHTKYTCRCITLYYAYSGHEHLYIYMHICIRRYNVYVS
jgi:hypothetical protein